MTHTKVSQFWTSESGCLITGREHAGYYVVCSCGAELWAGREADFTVPLPPRLEELRDREMTLTPEEDAEYTKLWKKWRAAQDVKLEESNKLDHQHMREAIEKHATDPATLRGEARP